jgi:membrane protease YdiL (CAAX protease family)
MSFAPKSADGTRLSNLDNRLLVLAVFVGLMCIYIYGAYTSPYPYSDPRFAIGYFGTELQVVAALVVVTAAFFPRAPLGLCWPQAISIRDALPLLLVLCAAVAVWLTSRMTMPPGTADNTAALLTLQTTMLVGVSEEWIFRGLVLAAACRWFGMRRGIWAALVSFGCFHLLNIIVGVPPATALFQLLSTVVAGAVFLVGAIATRSILLPIIVHGIYDFAVIDMAAMSVTRGSNPYSWPMVLFAYVLGFYCLYRLTRLRGDAPYSA